jgi:hypothetical protein
MRRDNGTGPTIGNVLEVSESPLDQALVLAASKCDLEALRDALLKGAHGMDLVVDNNGCGGGFATYCYMFIQRALFIK